MKSEESSFSKIDYMLGFGNNNEEKAQIAQEKRQSLNDREKMIVENSLKQSDEIDINASPNRQFDIVKFTQGVENSTAHKLYCELRSQEIVDENTGESRPITIFAGKDEKGEDVFVPMRPMINDLGARKIVSMARPFFTVNMINSNFQDKPMNIMMRQSCEVLLFDLYYNCVDYGLGFQPNHADVRSILRMYKNYIKPGPHRAWNNGERRHTGGFTKKVETTLENRREEKTPGLFGG